MKKINIAKVLSQIATALCVFGFYNVFLETSMAGAGAACIVLGVPLGLVSYCFCGLVSAIGTPFSWAKWGFFFGPFPVNLLNVVALFLAGIFFVIAVPAVPVFRRATQLGC